MINGKVKKLIGTKMRENDEHKNTYTTLGFLYAWQDYSITHGHHTDGPLVDFLDTLCFRPMERQPDVLAHEYQEEVSSALITEFNKHWIKNPDTEQFDVSYASIQDWKDTVELLGGDAWLYTDTLMVVEKLVIYCRDGSAIHLGDNGTYWVIR